MSLSPFSPLERVRHLTPFWLVGNVLPSPLYHEEATGTGARCPSRKFSPRGTVPLVTDFVSNLPSLSGDANPPSCSISIIPLIIFFPTFLSSRELADERALPFLVSFPPRLIKLPFLRRSFLLDRMRLSSLHFCLRRKTLFSSNIKRFRFSIGQAIFSRRCSSR